MASFFNKNKVAVCMSTYNGEKYLGEQIDSILNQRYSSIWLFIRDDGSSDQTADIIREYCSTYSNIVFMNDGEVHNIGAKYSYLSIISFAYRLDPSFDYFAFADQDDLWKEDKIDRAVSKLDEASSSPAGRLYFSNKTITDSDLNLLYEEKLHIYGDYLESLFTNSAYGCTMVFDRVFAELLSSHLPKHTSYHDNWAYRLAKTLGSTIVFDTESNILYRQHANNTEGIHEQKNRTYYLKAIRNRLLSKSDHLLQMQIEEIAQYFPDQMLCSDQKEVVNSILHYQNNIKDKIRLLKIDGLEKRTLTVIASWFFKVIFNRL